MGFQAGDGTKGGDGIYNEDGSINTRKTPTWKSLPFKDQNLVIDEKKQLGIRYKEKSGAKSWELGNLNHVESDPDPFNRWKEQNQKYKSNIKALKRSKNSEDYTDKEQLDAGY